MSRVPKWFHHVQLVRFLDSSLYVLQVTMSYFLMFVAMTFNPGEGEGVSVFYLLHHVFKIRFECSARLLAVAPCRTIRLLRDAKMPLARNGHRLLLNRRGTQERPRRKLK